MKTSIKRCTLALIMCGMTAGSMMAQEIILEQDFNSLSVGMGTVSIPNWTTSNCSGVRNITKQAESDNIALKIETSGTNSGSFGYATTPTYNYSGDAILSFSHAYTGNTSSKVTVSIQGGGHFEGNIDSKTYDVTVKNSTSTSSFTKEALRIIGFTNTTTITFTLANKDSYIAIDDVNIVSTEPFVLDEDADNSNSLSTYKGKTVNVTTRQFKGGIWNTMCLPFDVDMATMEAALGSNQDIQLRKYTSYDATNNAMNFTPVTGSTVITAGTPFLVWLNNDVASPTFEMVTISKTAAKTVKYNNVSLVGTYSPKLLKTDGTELFLTTRNTLAIPGTGEGKNRIKGMRAYISVPESLAPTIGNARIAFLDVPTAISAVKEQQPATAVYNLSGQKVDGVGAGPVPARLRKGLYIVNGKKVIKY